MARFILSLMELGVSAAVHLLFGFYVFSTAVAADLSQAAAASGALLLRRPAAPDPAEGLVDVAAAGRDEEGRGAAPVVLDGSPPPIVLVHGIFGFGKGRLGGLSYFAGAEKKDDRVLVPDLGSLTSVHDRARELFYYLKGGEVDYGEEHSKACGHARFGRTYDRGHYPVWDDQNPVHFVGHSAGAQVVRVLHQMLADKRDGSCDQEYRHKTPILGSLLFFSLFWIIWAPISAFVGVLQQSVFSMARSVLCLPVFSYSLARLATETCWSSLLHSS